MMTRFCSGTPVSMAVAPQQIFRTVCATETQTRRFKAQTVCFAHSLSDSRQRSRKQRAAYSRTAAHAKIGLFARCQIRTLFYSIWISSLVPPFATSLWLGFLRNAFQCRVIVASPSPPSLAKCLILVFIGNLPDLE